MGKERLGERPMSELPLDVKEHLETLLGRSPSELAHGDLAFLHGRREYLSENQRNMFGITEKTPVDPNAPEEQEPRKLLSVKDAQKELKKRKIEFNENASRVELNDLLVEADEAEEEQE